jgi:D-xylose reductase
MVNVPNIKLNNGKKMPQVGFVPPNSLFFLERSLTLRSFGLWKVPTDSAADTVYNAIKSGYRLFDGAFGTPPLLRPLHAR